MDDERALIRRLKRGDTEALREFYESLIDPLYRFVYFQIQEDKGFTEDIVQETFLRAIRSLSGFSPGKGSLQAWLCGIARNCIREHWRGLDKQAALVQSLTATQAEPSSGSRGLQGDPPLDTRERVNITLAQMPRAQASALVTKYVAGKSVREIAVGLGKSEKAVESLLSRGREAFRRHFREQARDDEEKQ